MIVNGVDLSKYMLIKRINRQLAPNIENKVFDVPGMHGAHHIRNIRKARKIEVEFAVIGSSVSDRIEKAHIIAGYITSEQDMIIILPDEPDKVYIGSLSGETNLEEIRHVAQGTLAFFCSDPHILDTGEQTAQFDANGQLTVMNDGTAETYPSFSIAFNQPTTHFEIINHTTNQAVKLGNPLSVWDTVDDQPIDREELFFFDTMGSTSGWQTGDQVDGGVVTGEFQVVPGIETATAFGVSDYGTGERWHGPALKRSLASPIQDFRLETIFRMNNSAAGSVGRIEIYLLDINGNHIGKIALKDINTGSQRRRVEARAGTLNNGVYFLGGELEGWRNFTNWLKIERIGNRWRAWIDQRDSLRRVTRFREAFYTDFTRQFMARLAAIQVHIGASRNRVVTTNLIEEVKVYRINEPQQPTEIPVIVHSGDTVEIDNGLNRVLRNGEPLNQIIALENEFFALERGANHLEVFPKGIATVTMNWRRRWV